MQAQEMLVEDAPWVPIAYAKPPVGFQENVQGYQANPTGGEPFNTVTLAGGAARNSSTGRSLAQEVRGSDRVYRAQGLADHPGACSGCPS